MKLNKPFWTLLCGSVLAIYILLNVTADNKVTAQTNKAFDPARLPIGSVFRTKPTIGRASELRSPNPAPVPEEATLEQRFGSAAVVIMLITAILGLATECLRFIQFGVQQRTQSHERRR